MPKLLAGIASYLLHVMNNGKTRLFVCTSSKKSVLWPTLGKTLGTERFDLLVTARDIKQKTLPLSSGSAQRKLSKRKTLSSSKTFNTSAAIPVSLKIMGISSTNTQKCDGNILIEKSVPNITCLRLRRKFSTTARRDMRLVQFVYNSEPSSLRVGFMTGCGVTDVNTIDPSMPNDMLSILRQGYVYKIYEMYCQQACFKSISCSCITLRAPLYGMDKILCVGLNYMDHCSTHNVKPPDVPMIFSKFPSSIIGPTDPIRVRTGVTKKVDWEAELCLVIGETASSVPAEEAMNYVMGYTVAQDLTARDWTAKENNLGQLILGKSMDTFCPIGPWITTTDEVQDINNLQIRCFVNGCVKQDGKTDQMIFKIPFLIERISSVMTLYPGDLILTGTPAGVGQYSKPPEFLEPGDVLTSVVENVGVMSHHVLEFS